MPQDLINHAFACVQVLAAAGAVDHEQLVKLASAAFGGIPDEDDTTSVRALTTKVCASSARLYRTEMAHAQASTDPDVGPGNQGHNRKAEVFGEQRV